MRISLLPDGSVRFSHLNPWEVQTLRAIPSLADPAGSHAAEQRLYPAPAVPEDLTPELAVDWVEYALPDLRAAFTDGLETVARDLENMEQEPLVLPVPDLDEDGAEQADDEDDGESEDDGDDADSDFSGDEADEHDDNDDADRAAGAPPAPILFHRLVLPAAHLEKWYLAMNQARLVLCTRHGVDPESPSLLATLIASGNVEKYFQYETLGSIQGWLLEIAIHPDQPRIAFEDDDPPPDDTPF